MAVTPERNVQQKWKLIYQELFDIFSESKKQDCDLIWKEVVDAFNNSVYSTTGYSPAQVMLDREYRIFSIKIMFSNTRTNTQKCTHFECEDKLIHIS